jgi:hypothetical protein
VKYTDDDGGEPLFDTEIDPREPREAAIKGKNRGVVVAEEIMKGIVQDVYGE